MIRASFYCRERASCCCRDGPPVKYQGFLLSDTGLLLLSGGASFYYQAGPPMKYRGPLLSHKDLLYCRAELTFTVGRAPTVKYRAYSVIRASFSVGWDLLFISEGPSC